MSCEFSSLLQKLFVFLSNNSSCLESEINIFRAHNNNLDVNGDLSLPLNAKAWEKYLMKSPEQGNKITEYLFKYEAQKYDEIYFDLIANSNKFPFQISKCVIEKEKLLIFLNRTQTSKQIISLINSLKNNYVSFTLPHKRNIIFETEIVDSNVSKMDLTDLRMKLLKDVLPNFLKIAVVKDNFEDTEKILLTNKSLNQMEGMKKIVCGVVISNKFGKKNTMVTAEEYYNKRVIDMRLIAQHKYGVRVNSEPGWGDFFNKLGQSAVSIDLLHVKCNRTIAIDVDNASSSHIRGASFILYNCARLAKIFKQFDQKVQQGIYPPLLVIEDIDFALLNQPEEWEMLYVHLFQYPIIVKSCVKYIFDAKINVHNLCTFLDSLCSIFSVYYRRVRILTEPRQHLFLVLHARIYLLKAIEIILHHALGLLNISPVTQM